MGGMGKGIPLADRRLTQGCVPGLAMSRSGSEIFDNVDSIHIKPPTWPGQCLVHG